MRWIASLATAAVGVALCLPCAASSDQSAAARQSASGVSLGPWRLVRTPNMNGGRDGAAIMRVADLERSDPDIAGLTVSCTSDGLRAAVVVVDPIAPRARPHIVLKADQATAEFDATVIPPGAQILLPVDIRKMVGGDWRNADMLNVKIANEGETVSGSIPIDGLSAALDALDAMCDQ